MVLQTTRYIVVSLLVAVLGIFAAGCIIVFTNPLTAGTLTFAFFYASIFAGILGLSASLGLLARQKFTTEPASSYLTPSMRQACFIALLVVISLLLQSERLLYWWVEGSIVLFFIFIEIFFNL